MTATSYAIFSFCVTLARIVMQRKIFPKNVDCHSYMLQIKYVKTDSWPYILVKQTVHVTTTMME